MLPGGGIEGDESVEETAIRETKEETDYNIAIKKLIYVTEWINEKRGKNVLYLIFLGKIKSGDETHLKDPTLEEGHIRGIEWIDLKHLHKIKFYPKEIIPLLQKDYLNRFKKDAVYVGAFNS